MFSSGLNRKAESQGYGDSLPMVSHRTYVINVNEIWGSTPFWAIAIQKRKR